MRKDKHLDKMYPVRAPQELLAAAQRKAEAEGVNLALVLRVFMQRYVEGGVGLTMLLGPACAPAPPVAEEV